MTFLSKLFKCGSVSNSLVENKNQIDTGLKYTLGVCVNKQVANM